jgi:hypothetical protein
MCYVIEMVEPKRPRSSIMGSPAPDKARVVNCPVCKQNVGGLRFAYHLQKCMGGGSRQSSKDRRRKMNANATAAAAAVPEISAAEEKMAQKLSRLESDKEHFTKNPIILRIRLNEKGKRLNVFLVFIQLSNVTFFEHQAFR